MAPLNTVGIVASVARSSMVAAAMVADARPLCYEHLQGTKQAHGSVFDRRPHDARLQWESCVRKPRLGRASVAVACLERPDVFEPEIQKCTDRLQPSLRRLSSAHQALVS